MSSIGFDQYSRYKTFQLVMEHYRDGDTSLRVLDVGGRGNRMREFLPSHDTVQYLEPEVIPDAEENYVHGDGLNMEFEDNAYDWLVSADVFEHIPADKREQFLVEQVRVAKQGVVLSAPFNTPGVSEVEREVNVLYKSLTGGRDHPWLIEHFENGLPEMKLVQEFCKKHNYDYTVVYNNDLRTWKKLLTTWLLAEELDEKTRERILASLNTFYAETYFYQDTSLNPFESYRKIFVIHKNTKPLSQSFAPFVAPKDTAELQELVLQTLVGIAQEITVDKNVLDTELVKLRAEFAEAKTHFEKQERALYAKVSELEAELQRRSVRYVRNVVDFVKRLLGR